MTLNDRGLVGHSVPRCTLGGLSTSPSRGGPQVGGHPIRQRDPRRRRKEGVPRVVYKTVTINPKTIVLSDADLRSGRMPDVCVLSGDRTTALFPVRFGRPLWVYLFGGVLGVLVMRLLGLDREVRGRLPMSLQARRSRVWRLALGSALIAIGVFLGLAFLPTGEYVAGVGGIIGFGVGCWLFYEGTRRGLRARVKRGLARGELWVEIQVHPAFADAREKMFRPAAQTTLA